MVSHLGRSVEERRSPGTGGGRIWDTFQETTAEGWQDMVTCRAWDGSTKDRGMVHKDGAWNSLGGMKVLELRMHNLNAVGMKSYDSYSVAANTRGGGNAELWTALFRKDSHLKLFC